MMKNIFDINTHEFTNIGDTIFLMYREIVVVIKVYSLFRFVAVHYLEETKGFV